MSKRIKRPSAFTDNSPKDPSKIYYLENITELRAIDVSTIILEETIHLLGLNKVTDGLANTYQWIPSNALDDNGSTIISPASNPALGRWIEMDKLNDLKQLENVLTVHTKPSEIALPSILSDLKVYSVNNKVNSSIGPYDLIDTSIYTKTYFVDGVSGIDSNSGLTWASRKKSIGNAMRTAAASGGPARILVHANINVPYYRQISAGDDGLDRSSPFPILLEAINGRVQHGAYDNVVWAKTGGLTYTYQATRTQAIRCLNPTVKANDGLYTDYTWVASSALVDTTEGSWYTDGTTVYVRPHGNVEPTIKNTRVLLSGVTAFRWNCNQNLVVRGFDFEGGPHGTKISGGSTNTVVFDDCTFRYSAATNTFNGGTGVIDGLQVLGCGTLAAFNCSADRNSKDGFNFHNEGAVLPFGLLVNCKGNLNGLNPSISNNGFTCHDGVTAISIGCDWTGNYGCGSGHVNDNTKVWSIGDTAGGSMGDVIYGGTIVFGGFGVWSGAAKMWLDSCKDIGVEYGVYSGDTARIYIRNHKGSGRRVSAVEAY